MKMYLKLYLKNSSDTVFFVSRYRYKYYNSNISQIQLRYTNVSLYVYLDTCIEILPNTVRETYTQGET